MQLKKISLFILLVTAASFSFSQNWQLINPAWKYNYYSLDPNVASATIWTDSVKSTGNYTDYYLNRLIAHCDTCISAHLAKNPYDTSYQLSNQPGFLQRKARSFSNGLYHLTDKGNIVIHTTGPLLSSWIFDSVSNISAQLITKTIMTVFSSTDSVQKIKLSSGDTVIFSKSFGLLQYPGLYGVQQYYKLAGIEGNNTGLQTLKFKDFFNFSPGDVFQYSRQDNNYIFFPPYYQQGLVKYKIISRIQNTGTIRYQVHTTSLDSAWLGNNPPSFTHVSRIDTLTFTDSVKHFTNLYANEAVLVFVTPSGNFSTPSINQLQTGIDSKGLAVKWYGINCPAISATGTNYGVASSVDTINKYLYLIRNSVLILGRETKAGLGITSDVYNNYDEVKTLCMSAYIKGTDTVGTIIPDSELSSIAANKTNEKTEITLFPNPSHEQVTLNFSSPFSGKIEIYNTEGRCVFSDKAVHTMTFLVETRAFNPGIYLVKCNRLNSFVLKRMIVQ